MTAVPRVYADSSVFGGCFDEEFAEDSQAFFAQVRQGRFKLVVSPLVAAELELAPAPVLEMFEAMLAYADVFDPDDETLAVRQAYLEAGILTERWSNDALHVACAVVAHCEAILSWNFRHIVHYDKIPLYNAVNVLHGHGSVAIHTPPEVLRYEEDL